MVKQRIGSNWLLAATVSLLLAASAQAASPQSDDFRNCLTEPDVSACIVREALIRTPASERATLSGLLSVSDSDAPQGAALKAAADAPPDALAYRAVWLARHGAAPDAALAPIVGLRDSPSFDAVRARLTAYAALCALAARSRAARLKVTPSSRVDRRLAPSPALASLAFELWARELTEKRAQSLAERDATFGHRHLAGCWAEIGDAADSDKSFAIADSPDDRDFIAEVNALPSARVELLVNELRLDEAAVSAERTIDEGVDVRQAIQWSRAQRLRAKLLLWASSAGRADIADRMTTAILQAASAPSRSRSTYFGPAQSYVAQAFAYLVRTNPVVAEQWAERLDPLVRPGGPDFNFDDTIAVFRTWNALRRPDKARSLYEAMAARLQTSEGADEGEFLGRMQGAEGRYDEAMAHGLSAYNILYEDFVWGVGVQRLDAVLARAGSQEEREHMLRLCVVSGDPFGLIEPTREPGGEQTPLDSAAACARRMSAPGPVALNVAERAAQAGRIDLMREMRALALRTMSPEQQPQFADILLDTALADLDAVPKR